MSYVVCSDLHLGAKKFGRIDKETDCDLGLLDTLNCFDAIIDFVVDNHVPLFFIAGDIYKNASPSSLEHREFAKRIKRLCEEEIQTYIVLGNHDIFYREGSYHAVSYLQELKLPNVKIVDKPQVVKWDNPEAEEREHFLLIPYQHKAKLKGKDVIEHYKEIVTRYQERLKKAVPDKAFCIGHQLIAGAKIGSWATLSCANEPVIPIELFSEFDATILGHIHIPQMIDEEKQIVYCGAVDRLTFGDAKGERGFVYYNDEKLKSMKVQTREFLDFKFIIKSIEDVTKMFKKLEEIDVSHAVKISINVDEQNLKLIDTNKILSIAKKAYYTFIPCPLLSIQRHKETRSSINEETSAKDALKEYVTKVVKAKDSEELIRRGEQIITEAEVR